MEPTEMRASGDPSSALPSRDEHTIHLRLYVARSTPNSVRAEQKLSVVLERIGDRLRPPELEIIDVFSQPRRAVTDGVVVTPTLIGTVKDRRMVFMEDLSNQDQLQETFEDLTGA